MDLKLRSTPINFSQAKRRQFAELATNCPRGGCKQSASPTTRILLSVVFILISYSQTTKCLQESTAKLAVEIKQPSLLPRGPDYPEGQQPSQSFTSAPTTSDERQKPTANSPANLWRPPIGNERENEFFMSALTSEQLEKNQQQSAQSAVSELPATSSTSGDEDTTTKDHQLFDTTTTVACPGDPTNPVAGEQNVHSDEQLIAINTTRKQFVTHDQLLTEVEPRQSQTNDSSTYQKIAQSSRAGMSRLASSFGLADLFSRYARPKTSPPLVPLQHQPDQTVDEQKGATSQQQLQSTASCPGVCLDLLTASLRCRNAIAASCPSFFQKCCELDDVSFNGTPVETSAPITGGDSDNNSVSSASDAAQAGEQVPGDQQPAISTTLRPPTTATPTGTTTAISEQQSVGLEQRRQQPQLQSSIYFFSSASDDNNSSNKQQQQPGAERQNSSLEHRQQVWPASTNGSASAVGTPQSSVLAKPVGQQLDYTTNGNQKIPSASQSFDLSLASSTPDSTKSSLSLVNNRVVVLQTANGTAYLIPSQQSRPRPLYANWTDYKLLMTQMRPQQTNGASSSVVYHSNIDPVRKLTAGDNSTSSTPPVHKQTNDLTEKQLIDFSDKAAHDNDTLKVLKDQHSSSLAKQHFDVISSTEQTLISKSNSTTNQPKFQQTTPATRTEDRFESTASTTAPIQQHQQSQTDLVETTTVAPETNSQDVQQSPVSGIANVLTSLFDAFMAPSSSTLNGDASDEARVPPSYNSAPDGDLIALSSVNAQNEQHNDRRLGLDLSFRQQNERSNGSAADRFQHMSDDGSLMMTSDGANETPTSSLGSSSNEPSDSCNGYCALDQYVGVCDSWYPTSACGSAQKCCVTGKVGFAGTSEGQGSNSEDQHSAASNSNAGQHSSRPSQVCQGTCLPVYHSSLCTKPNELQLDSPGCLPNQVCCNHPQEDGQAVDEHQQASRGNGNNVAQPEPQQQSLSSFVSELFSSGSSNKQAANTGDGLLSASLVPPPPPTISNLNQVLDYENGLSGTSSLPRQAIQQQQLLRQQTTIAYQQPTPRPILHAGAKAIHHQSNGGQPNGGSGGLMNQLFQMFKSNTGLGKQQRPKQHIIPQNFIQQPVYELQSQSYPMLTSGSAPQSQAILPTQVVFPMLQQQQQPVINSMTGTGQILMIPSQMQTTASSNPQAQQVLVQPYAGLSSAQTMTGFDVPGMQHQRNNRFHSPASMLTGLNQQQQQQQMVPVSKYPQTVDTMHMVLRQPQPQQQFSHQLAASNQFTQEQQQQQLFNQVSNYQLMQHQQQQQQQQQQVVAQKMNPINRPLQHQPISDVPNPVPSQHNSVSGTNNFHLNANGFRIQNNNIPPLTQTQSGSSKWTPQHLPYQQPPLEPLPTNAQRQNQPGNGNGIASNGLVSSASNNQITKEYPPTRQMVVDQPTNGRQQWVATSPSNGNSNNALIPKQQHRIVQNINNDFIRPTIQQQWNRLQPEPDTNVVSLATRTELNHNKLVSTRSPTLQRPKPTAQHSNSVQANPVQRVSGTPTIVTTTSQPPAIKAAINGQAKQPGSAMVSDASNVNVMISSQDDNGAMRQRPGYSYSPSSEQSGEPQVSTTSRSPPLIINNDEEATVADESEDQGASSPSSLDNTTNERPPCRYACLAPMLSFDCVHPNYIDDSLACPSIGEVCCVRGAPFNSLRQQEGSLSSMTPTNTRYGTSASPTTSVDSNKLDNQPVSLDESSISEESHLSSGTTSDNGTDAHNSFDSPTVVVNTLEDDQQTSSNVKQTTHTTSKATACGLPGPARKRGRISSGQARGRVLGGFDSEPGHWCWQAALMNDKNEYLCGGALIGTKWVLTAAHCITQHLRSESQLYVRLGQTNLNNSDVAERKAARSVLVKTSYVHHNHNGVTLDNDIALLRLEDSIDLEVPTICTICLPERAGEGSQRNQLAPGKRCTVTGYGFEHESGPAALRVRQTDLPIVSDSECQNKTSLVLGKPFSLPASSFCAGGELGQDACHGDGGSPLACLVDGFYELTGIVSWGYKCGNKDLPGLYAKVTNFVGWINQIVSVNN